MYSIFNLVLFNITILFISFIFTRVKNFEFLKILLISLIISFFFGFRPIDIGSDTINYYSRFVSFSSSFEVGFRLFSNLIFTIFGPNYRVYFFLISFITIFNLLIAFKSLIKDPFYILSAWIVVSLPYSILMQINIIRQGFALSFFLLGISFFFNKNIFLGILLSFIATTFHSTVIIYITSFFITFLVDFKKYTKIYLLFFFFIISLFGLPFLLINFFDIPYINTRLLNGYSGDNNLFFFSKILFYFLLYVIIEILMFEKEDLSQKKLSLLYFIILSSSVFILQNELYSIRYLLALDFLLVPYLLIKGSFYKNKHYLLVIFAGIFIVFLFSIFTEALETNFNF